MIYLPIKGRGRCDNSFCWRFAQLAIASHLEGVCVLRTASPQIMAKHGGAVDPSLVKTCKRSKEVHR